MVNDSSANIGIDTPYDAAAQITSDRLYIQVMRNLPGTLGGEDIEALHDMRVASRRLRAALRVFGPCFRSKDLKPVVAEVRNITQALGSVRDQDVFLDFLAGYAKSSGADIAWLIEHENIVRENGRSAMIQVLGDLKQSDLPKRMAKLIGSATNAKSINNERFVAQAPGQIAPRLADLLDLSATIQDPSKAAELHQMRIASKRLRYTLEAFAPCFGRRMQERISEVKLLQEFLGDIHDCDVWIDKLRQHLAAIDPATERAKILEQVIAERTAFRAKRHSEAVVHWQKLTDSRFAENVMGLVSMAALIPSSTLSIMQGVIAMEQDAGIEVTVEEAPEEQAAPTPPKKRSRSKKKNPDVEATPVANETEPVAEDSDATAPVVEDLGVVTVVEGSIEDALTALEELIGAADSQTDEEPEDTVDPTTELVEAMLESPTEVIIDVEPIEETDELIAAVEAEAAPGKPEHPAIVELKELVLFSTARLTEMNALTPMLAKQLGKLNALLEVLPKGLRKAKIKDAIKAEKAMAEIHARLTAVTEDGGLSKKRAKKLTEDLRSMRKTLADKAGK
jgi:CHAD domain-containing protein